MWRRASTIEIAYFVSFVQRSVTRLEISN